LKILFARGNRTTVHCPNTECQEIHAVEGNALALWYWNDEGWLQCQISEWNPSSCVERNLLALESKKALNAYVQQSRELAGAVGSMIHSEFECLSRQVEGARLFYHETRRRLKHHVAEHGC
jgi:hypothetical protein